jgi:hypothetical protein
MTPTTTPAEPRPLRVLLATDGSPDARNAAEWLARFPLARGSRILVLSAVAIPPSPITFPGLEDLQRSLLAEGRRACDEAADLLRSHWPALEISVVDGESVGWTKSKRPVMCGTGPHDAPERPGARPSRPTGLPPPA